MALVIVATVPAAPAEKAPMRHDQPRQNRAPLQASAFARLPLGSVTPAGWLDRQLRLQKEGLTGHAEQIYDALTPDSAWLGGDGENWERGPYYVRGLIALAHTLDDEELKERAQKWIDWTLQSQRPDGFFGPTQNDDWWPRMVVAWYLRDHYEATGDERVLPFLTRYFRHQLEALPDRPLRDWGRARAGDNLDVVLWTYNRTGDRFLLDLAKLLREQAYPWSEIYTENQFYGRFEEFHPHHIVNVSQAFKFPPVAWTLTGDAKDRAAFDAGVANLQRQYGRIDGQISGTEMLSGLSSTDGVELCADVERILSNGVAIRALGDAVRGDEMEKVAYNSLPAHTTARMTGITYYQFPNQIAATHGQHGFEQDYANVNMPGPHSGFPCCCYNWHIGWPGFVQNMWAATNDEGLAILAYGPNVVRTTVAGGVPITIEQTTDYPFKQTVSLSVQPERAATFPLVLRVPGWADDASITVNGEPVDEVKAGTFHRIEREWQAGDRVELSFPMTLRQSSWINDSIGLERGPLAFALKMESEATRFNDYLGDFDEYEIRPTQPWNYAILPDVSEIVVEEHAVPEVPWSTEHPAVVLSVPAKRLDEWGLRPQMGTAAFGLMDNGWKPGDSKQVPLPANEPHAVRVEVEGNRLRVFVNDMATPVLERLHEPDFPRGWIGLRAYETTARFDDVRLNGTLVADFSDGAEGWKTFGGDWTVEEGQFIATPARDAKAVYEAGGDLGDFTLEFTVEIDAGGDAGVMFRGSDAKPELDGFRGYYVGFSTRGGPSEDAAEPPQSPVQADTPLQIIDLVPFGATRIRVSYFPRLGVEN